jgi:hypothetical protein
MRKFSLFFSGQYGSTQVALEKFKSSAPKPFGAAFQTERQLFGEGVIPPKAFGAACKMQGFNN